MIEILNGWAWGSDSLLWFFTTLVQVTLIAAFALLTTRVVRRNAAVRHSVLTAAIVLIAVAPWSTYCLQRAGLGMLTLTKEKSSSKTDVPLVLSSAEGSSEPNPSQTANNSSDSTSASVGNDEKQERAENESTVGVDDQRLSRSSFDKFNATAAVSSLADGNYTTNRDKIKLEQSTLGIQHTSWIKLFSILAFGWLVGSLVMAIRWAVAWHRLREILARAKAVESAEIESSFSTACRISGCKVELCRVAISNSIATPVVAGIFQPKILIPETLLGTVSSEQLIQIFIHELAHIRRRDHVVLVVQQLARVLFWAHPMVAQVCQRLTQASEEICDNHVLSKTPSKAYSQTLLTVAELAMGSRNPVGSIGVVGGWSLSQRVAGLLDNGRDYKVQLSRRACLGVACIASALSLVLLLTFKVTELVAVGSPGSPALVQETSPLAIQQEAKDAIRGTGDKIEFRLRGRLLTSGEPLVNPTVSISQYGSEQTFTATCLGDRYEVWLPAKAFRWLSFSIKAESDDGRRGLVIIGSSRLRKAINEGADIVLQQPTHPIKVLVKHKGQPVDKAHIKVITNDFLDSHIVKTDARGEAVLKLSGKGNISALTVWTDSGLLGGHQFHQAPPKDPNATEHVVELLECRERKIHVVDNEGSAVAGVRLKLQVATPRYYNYFGNPTRSDVVTDATGTANYRWFPKLDEPVHHYAELVDQSDWLLQSQSNTDDAVEVIVARLAKRVRVEGQVSRGGQYAGGIVVEAYSFQGEREGHSDLQFAISDQEGNFGFDALPNSTYALFVLDDQWVSEPQVFTPVDPVSGAKSSPYLMAIEGQTVTIKVTSGPDKKPIAGQVVSLSSEIPYSWKEAGERQNGTASRQNAATTDEQGLARAFVPLGNLRASVYSSSWRSESKIVVQADKENLVELHRAQGTAMKVNGRIQPPANTTIDLTKIAIKIQAIDGETPDEFTPTVSDSGSFSFTTTASAIGCLASSADGQWAAATTVEDLTKPVVLELLPTAYLAGQLVNGDGEPIANHSVAAAPRLENRSLGIRTTGFSRCMYGKSVIVKTDAKGNYRLGPLPRQVEIHLHCDPLGPTEDNGTRYLGSYFIEPGEQRPPEVHRLGQDSSTPSKLTTEEKVSNLLRDARLGGFHAMMILGDFADERCNQFVQENLMDYDANKNVSSYMQMRFNTGPTGDKGKAFATAKKWPLADAGTVTAIALDASGNELGRTTIDFTAAEAKEQTAAFVEKHLPPVVDAQQKWDEAFALAKKTNRRVWVRISQRYCNPCFLLSRWMDEHRTVLEKEFVLLKIDDVRDKNGGEVADRITEGKPFSIPFFAFYDADQKMLANSLGPTGNIGYMSGYEGKRHFRRMLQKAKHTLSDQEIEQFIGSIED